MVSAIVSNSAALEIIQTVRGLYLALQDDNPRFVFSPAATVFNGLHSTVAKTIARGSGVPSPSSARSVVPSGPVSLYFIFLIRFYVDLCLPSVTLVMAKRVRLPHLLLRRLRPQGVRLTWLPMLRCLFNIFFLVPLELILLRYFCQMVLDDMAMEIATDPGVSSKDEVPNAPSASKKRAAPKDSEKVRSFYFSSS